MKYSVFVFLFSAVGVTAQAANCSEVEACLKAGPKNTDACGDNERCLCGTHKEIAKQVASTHTWFYVANTSPIKVATSIVTRIRERNRPKKLLRSTVLY
ncbi:hypothetical protein BFJ70_g14462 [Fusarium oxysporum]|nr:hypothetical protein BFJ70_g14462 [Fusarium oxysporum]